ncbi:MAG: A/G-specific adenine glycosylase [Tepidisphaeraceae bacterium]
MCHALDAPTANAILSPLTPRSFSSLRLPLLKWYDRSRRPLPWRAAPGVLPDPYAVMVSEFMLQQTQVTTVIPYFLRFMEKFPSVSDLAAADEHDVLRLWQGLGYYSRARNLRAAARCVVEKHSGKIPAEIDALLDLPGIGRYTAGAIASLAFDKRAAILDGNVARVLCRLNAIQSDPRNPRTNKKLWQIAAEIVPAKRPGDFNSALMELGATICTPRQPQCHDCPLRRRCAAHAAGSQDQIPPRKKSRPTPLERRWVFAIRNGNRWLIEQRPARGRWASLWQFITIPAPNGAQKVTIKIASRALGTTVHDLLSLAEINHTLTHRRYEFAVFSCRTNDPAVSESTASIASRRWVTLNELSHFPLPKPHVTIANLLRAGLQSPSA